MGKEFTISVSINDFAPLLRTHEFMFRRLEETGVDGVEIVMGVKSRWSASYYASLSKKYNLPITSIHQPIWSGLEMYADDGFLKFAADLNVKNVVFHPLPRAAIRSPKMHSYFKKLASFQKQYGIRALVENLPVNEGYPFIKNYFPVDPSTSDMLELYQAAEEFDLHLTLDIDHLHVPAPHKEPWFEKILPRIANVHLSSFEGKKEHLPLYLGKFQSLEFVSNMQNHKYKGLYTLEIYYPSVLNLLGYNFEAIKRSVGVLHDR